MAIKVGNPGRWLGLASIGLVMGWVVSNSFQASDPPAPTQASLASVGS